MKGNEVLLIMGDVAWDWVSQERRRRHIYILYTHVALQAAGLRYTNIIRTVFRISYTNPFSFLFLFLGSSAILYFFMFETELRNTSRRFGTSVVFFVHLTP